MVRARSIDIESGVQTPLVPADAGTQALLQKLGSRVRGNKRGCFHAKQSLSRLALSLSLALVVLGGSAGAEAQNYPARTVTVIVPFAAGGPADITGRIVADIFARHL